MKSLLGIILSSLSLSMICVDKSNAQSLSNLISSSLTQQATNSTVVVTVTATPPANFASRYWQIRWTFDGALIGNALFDKNTTNTSASVTNEVFSRANISASMPMSPKNQFNSSLILRGLQMSDNGSVISVDGDSVASTPLPPLNFTLKVKDCPSMISTDITVEATSYIYNAQGIFKCSNNGELFESTGTRPPSSNTTCLASATWSGQDNLQCWSDPTVTLGGDLNVTEGNNLTLKCDYVDTTPTGNSSIFYVGDATYIRSKNESLVLHSLQRSDNNKVVTCQAVTPYTQTPANNNTGRSKNHTINVQYAPYQEDQTSCTWVVNQTGSCKVVFFSNPQSKFVSLILNVSGTTVINDGSNEISSSKYIQTFHFSRTKPTDADNGTYVLIVQSPAFSNNVSIFFDINIIDSLPTATTTTTTTTTMNISNSNLGLIIGASCGAVAAVSLLIVVIILVLKKRRNNKMKDNNHSSPLHLESNGAHMMNTFSDGGEQEERVNPLYGASTSQGYVDSTYATVDNKNKKEAKEEKVNPLYAASSEAVEQVGAAYAEVDVKKKGVSTEKEEKINPLYAPSDRPEQIDAAYAEVDVKKHKKKKEDKEEKINPLYAASSEPVEQVGAAFAEVDVKKKTRNKKNADLTEKEEKINPLYAASSEPVEQAVAAYAEVDVKQKKKNNKNHRRKELHEKEEKINPLYAPSDQPEQIAAAYAEVDVKEEK